MTHHLATAASILLTAASFGAAAQPVTVAVIPTTRGEIAVDPNPVVINGRGSGVIRFELRGSGFTFADRSPAGQRGIHIDGQVVSPTDLRPRGQGPNQNELGPCERIENGRAMNCPNRNSRPGIYKYTINLVGPDGQPLKPRDPIIINR